MGLRSIDLDSKWNTGIAFGELTDDLVFIFILNEKRTTAVTLAGILFTFAGAQLKIA